MRRAWLVLVVTLAACGRSSARPAEPAPVAAATATRTADPDVSPAFGRSTPEEQGIRSDKLVELTDEIARSPVPLFSLLVSRNGKLVYELYTSSLTREHAHYQMSVTKSFTSALVGVAIDHGLVHGPDTSIRDALPRTLFRDDAAYARFAPVTIKDVLGMSALDAQVTPHEKTPEAAARMHHFMTSTNRVAFALDQAILPALGESFQYTDITPMLAIGAVEHATGKSALAFATAALFGPMGFRNYEWMHDDALGQDNGAFGLRLRPIDMQKFGVLYLSRGEWGKTRLLSESWTTLSFSPWIKSKPSVDAPNYGWYWWAYTFAPGWTTFSAAGWKGQRIAVVPEKGLVVTMTACIEDGLENELFGSLLVRFLMPAVAAGVLPPDPVAQARLAERIEAVRQGPSRIRAGIESRMVPSVEPKGVHHAFTAPH